METGNKKHGRQPSRFASWEWMRWGSLAKDPAEINKDIIVSTQFLMIAIPNGAPGQIAVSDVSLIGFDTRSRIKRRASRGHGSPAPGPMALGI